MELLVVYAPVKSPSINVHEIVKKKNILTEHE